jgi:hypothetical protein
MGYSENINDRHKDSGEKKADIESYTHISETRRSLNNYFEHMYSIIASSCPEIYIRCVCVCVFVCVVHSGIALLKTIFEHLRESSFCREK